MRCDTPTCTNTATLTINGYNVCESCRSLVALASYDIKISEEELKLMMDKAYELMKLFPAYRLGQAYWEVLHEHYEEISVRIVGSLMDPYHIDENIFNFQFYFGENNE